MSATRELVVAARHRLRLPGFSPCRSHWRIEASMKRVAFFVVLGGVIATITHPSAMIAEQVRVDTGLLAGTVGTGQPSVRVFKGIPFAAPPIGENRWRAPLPAPKWEGVRKADAFGAPCAP